MTKPLILVSNDDGYSSIGINALARALSTIGDVVIVAPATDQSTISHAISLNRPLRLQEQPSFKENGQTVKVYSVDGTPTDSVYMGVHYVLKDRRPDLMVSGIKHIGTITCLFSSKLVYPTAKNPATRVRFSTNCGPGKLDQASLEA